LKTSADFLHAQEKEPDFFLDVLDGSHFGAKSDRLLDLHFSPLTIKTCHMGWVWLGCNAVGRYSKYL